MSVHFEGVRRAFSGVPAIDGLDLDVEPGSFTVVTGPPKSGKSVLFRLLVGLETLDAGHISLAGQDLAEVSAPERAVGYVPQSFALYPHMSVARNIGYPMALAKAPKADIGRRVDEVASMLAISHLLEKTPDQLSGGEKQRVAVARGLLKKADLFVFDDPLVGLDYKLRERLMDDLRELRERLGATFLYGTSDSVEALTLASHLVVLDAGRIVQQGPTETVYDAPSHARAMELVGFPRANVLKARIEDGALVAGPLSLVAGPRDADVRSIGVRPEALRGVGTDGSNAATEPTASPGRPGSLSVDGTVRLVEDLGGEIVVYVESGDGTLLTSSFAADERAAPALGERVTLGLDPGDVHRFDAGGSALGPAPDLARSA